VVREIPADRRQAILDAALDLFSEHTYGGTAMPLIAERAGVAAGTIYRYFPSKEDLANAVYRDCKLAMQAALSEHARSGAIRDQFRGLWRGLWAFSQANPAAFRFLETHHHTPYLDRASRAVGDVVSHTVADFVRRGQRGRAIRPGDPLVLIALAFGAFVGLVKDAADRHVVIDDKTLRASEDAVWAMLEG